ncbi:MAG TPA: hypothetical protein VHO69_13260 [Phototrophicaceae bacterium]|nr:hypothetical protein [Phototrophicaceae bacterium]
MSDYEKGTDFPRRSKYRHPRREISWIGLLLGLALGIGGGLFYAWTVDARVEYDTEPWQLKAQDRAHYVVAIALDYSYDSDLTRAIQRLVELRSEGDPIQELADVACQLATTGYASTGSGLRAIRSMMVLYQLQGRTGCADTLIAANEEPTAMVQIDLPTPTPLPPASKTPTPEVTLRVSPTPPRVIAPTQPPQSDYIVAGVTTFCSTELTGIIEVFVQDYDGQGVPGEAVRVRWDEGDDTFYTGLKPERGPGYSDFQMEAGKGYTAEMPGRSDPTSQPLVAAPCTTEGGDDAISSYRVFFRPG